MFSEFLVDTIVFKIMQQLVDIVGWLHKAGFVHNDLKLGNALINKYYEVTLIDFGMVMRAEDMVQWCGTPSYFLPERHCGYSCEGLAFKKDIYALGTVFFELYFGHKPYRGPQECARGQLKFPDDVSIAPWMKELLASMLATDPLTRPSIEQVGDNLANVIRSGLLCDQ